MQLPFAWYLLKVMSVTAILFGYYWLALRNKKFHRYNRFYLLTAIVVSWLIPLLKINFWEDVQQPKVMQLLTVVANGNLYMEQTNEFNWDWSFVMILIMLLVSFLLLVRFALAVIKIKNLIIKNPVKKWNNINFVFTNATGTPFSWFKYIFWNDQININSTVGDQILKHELAHVYEKHSIDKLFLGLAIIVNWYNPFLWLIRKELNMIHEFIADEKAIDNGDTSAFAAMLLETAYPAHSSMLINSFFHSPIKRRLLMITSSKKTSFTYLRRIVILPLLALTSVLFAFTIKKDTLSQTAVNTNSYQTYNNYLKSQEKLPDVIDANFQDTTFKKKRSNTAKVTVNNRDTMVTVDAGNSKSNTKMNELGKDSKSNLNKPFVVLDEKEMSWQEFEKKGVKPEEIQSMNVLKDKSATDKYGDKGRDGVIEITSKQNSEQGKYSKEQQQHLIEKQQFTTDKQKYTEAQQRYNEESQQQAKYQQRFNEEFSKGETDAQFPGGADAWRRYLEKNLNPNILAKNGAPHGDYPVLLEFDVSKDGEISNIMAQSKNGFGSEEEAIRIIKLGPKWVPAKKDGLSVASKVRQTITFRVS